MNQVDWESSLAGLPIGPIRYFDRTSSTNDEAASWAAAGAPDLALVIADEQTAGRGRLGRRWHTPPASALAASLVLRAAGLRLDLLPRQSISTSGTQNLATHLTALGALAVATALEDLYGLPTEIKWPNDVLVYRRKLAGILVEAQWQGDELSTAILGMGINVTRASVPDDSQVAFPATCVEDCLSIAASRLDAKSGTSGRADRLALLRKILEKLLLWRPKLGSPEFLQAWEERLAFKGEWVWVIDESNLLEGQILGLEPDGALLLLDRNGKERRLQVGDIHLKPMI